MIKSIKVMLLPNKKQNTKLFQTADTARYAYNWTLLALQMNNFKQTDKYLSDSEYRKLFAFHKQENQWLYNVSIGVESSKLNIQQNNNDGIGIDVKDLAIDSNNNKIFNINKTQTVKKLKRNSVGCNAVFPENTI